MTLVYTQNGATHRHALTPGDTVVGRAPACDLTIDDVSISRRHARFRVHGDRCRLTDIGGRNGTFLNGARVTDDEVADGDSVVLGRFPMHVEWVQAAAGAVLSDDHSMLEAAGTVLRKIGVDGPTGPPAAVEPERLLRLLTEISRQLVRPQPLTEMLDRIASVALDSVPADRVFLLLVDQ